MIGDFITTAFEPSEALEQLESSLNRELTIPSWPVLAALDMIHNHDRIEAINSVANSDGRTGFDLALLMMLNPLIARVGFSSCRPVIISDLILLKNGEASIKRGDLTLVFRGEYIGQKVDKKYNIGFNFLDVDLTENARVNRICFPTAMVDYRILARLNNLDLLEEFNLHLKELISNTSHDPFHSGFHRAPAYRNKQGVMSDSTRMILDLDQNIPRYREGFLNEEAVALSVNAMAYEKIRGTGFAQKIYGSAAKLMRICDRLEKSNPHGESKDMADALRSFVRYHVGNYVPRERLENTHYTMWLPILLTAEAQGVVREIPSPFGDSSFDGLIEIMRLLGANSGADLVEEAFPDRNNELLSLGEIIHRIGAATVEDFQLEHGVAALESQRVFSEQVMSEARTKSLQLTGALSV